VATNPIVATVNGLDSFRVIGGKTYQMKDQLDKPVTVAWGGMDPLGVCHDP
jgi:hypothetical protein